MEKYFNKFPVITYSNTQAIDITKRVTLLNNVWKNPYVFYPYDISDGERPDQFAARYYSDPYYSWILYLSNKIVDPYYGWYLDNTEFNEMLINKYGSMETAYDKIYYYRNNWSESENITISGYNALTPRLQLYWEPVYNPRGNITEYQRKQKNWAINTNKIISYEVSNTSFVNNEICEIYFDESNQGLAQILSISTDKIFLHHTSGVTLSNATVTITGNSYIYGRESEVNTSFSNTQLINENIVDEEEVYWKAITYYEHETEKNEFNKTIIVLDNKYSSKTALELEKLMEE